MAVHPGSIWIDANWNELNQYNNKWIAANENGIVISGGSFDDLLSIVIDRKDIQIKDVIFFFVTFDPVI